MRSLMVQMFYKQRADFERQYAERGRQYPLPEGISVREDVFYDEKHQPVHRLDIYRPKGREQEMLPVIIDVHGGGLLLGNKEFNRSFCAALSEAGYVVFSIEYQLIPDCLFYDQIRNLHMAFSFIKAHLGEYGGDVSRVYACGDSGDTCLLTYGVAMQRCTALAQAAAVKVCDLPVRALGLISGMFYTNRRDKIGLFLPRYLYGKNYKKSAYGPYVSPEQEGIINSLPPCFLVTSDCDHLKSYTIDFEKALTRHKRPHRLVCFPKDPRLTHAFSVFYPELAESKEVIRKLIHFFEHTEEDCIQDNRGGSAQ